MSHQLLSRMDQDHSDKPVAAEAPPRPKTAREARLAQALRANLRRRKQGATKSSSSGD